MEIYQFSVNDSTIYWLSCQTSQAAQKYNVQKNYTQQNEKVHSHKRKSLSLFQSGYIQLQSVVSSITSRKHSIQAVPSKKKKKLQEEKRKGKRGGKEEKKKKGMEGVCAKEGETDVEEEEKKKGRMRYGRKEERKEEGTRRRRKRRKEMKRKKNRK